ncbi:hypothetical protein GCM10008960_40520 [Deinococcus sedimenti]|uniref:Uncharacterized protein n=1 Tax=Deinococcus sedimenti TaxID=1867090 RepID=A0ABQ2SB78_9DEIO|nr:hypothetical protein GCM10008960_40520 [Deinococcus sedimenti]
MQETNQADTQDFFYQVFDIIKSGHEYCDSEASDIQWQVGNKLNIFLEDKPDKTKIVSELALYLKKHIGSGYSERNLRHMRKLAKSPPIPHK